MERLYLTTAQVAEILGMKRDTIYLRRKLGTFPPARKIGKNLLYLKDEIINWIESTKESGGCDSNKRQGRGT